jgi:hypothetical protein
LAFCCAIAARLPKVIEQAATAAIADASGIAPSLPCGTPPKKRRIIPKLAIFETTARKVVTGVGAPS